MLSRRPIVAVAVCFVIGIHAAAALSAVHAVLAVAGLLLLLPLGWARRWCSGRQAALYGAVLLCSASLYIATEHRNTSRWTPPDDASQPAAEGSWDGYILSPPERDGDRVQFQFRAVSWQRDEGAGPEPVDEKLLVQIRLSAPSELDAVERWERGQAMRLHGLLSAPGDASNFGAFSYRAYLRPQRIHWILQVAGAEQAAITDDLRRNGYQRAEQAVNQALARVDRVRGALLELMERLYKQPHSGYMQGLVLGSRTELDPDTYRQFSELGLTHVLAISGLHVGVFAGALLGLLRLLRLSKEKGLWVVQCCLPGYMLLTGAAPSVIRAGLMSMIALYCLRKGWLKDGLHILALVLVAMLLWDPYYALQIGFQLSFAVTAGLIIGVPRVVQLLPAWPLWLSSSAAVTLVAQAVSFPLTVYYFHQFSLLSFAANFLLVPFISLGVLPAGTLSLLAGLLYEPAARPLAWIVAQMNELTFRIVEWLAAIEGTSLIWPQLPLWWIGAYYGSLCLVFAAWRRTAEGGRASLRSRMGTAEEGDTQPLGSFVEVRSSPRGIRHIGSVLAAVPLVVLLAWGYGDGLGRDALVSFIDVGQGDGILIRTASGKHVLVDGGGTVNFRRPGDRWRERRVPFEIGEKVIVPLLKQRGVRRLDAVVLTHADQDHAGGLLAVLRHMPVSRFITNGTWKSSATMTALYRTALEKRIPISGGQAGNSWMVDEWTRIDVLYPMPDSDAILLPEEENQNRASLVLLLTLTHPRSKAQATMLLTGDVEADGERRMLAGAAGQGRLPPVDVYKVAHHGSRTSSTPEWVEAIRPAAGVISLGPNNRYGHPHPNVLATLARAQVPVLRTDWDGEIQFRLTAQGLKVRTKRDRIVP
ncbi:ComEC/Rec2 family competence protein [Paenibacillus dendritiformis]|uniref:DNA internalization-like competence protein ComEC/Rec2 n=1 Tax=Paenibacillus dendritiformis C454 TaxID=1131935 RepID=H3SE16_9BACL|nr:ComEC/Rec2 family competence protein [Paenibacillus dendritiformis]EHQ62692.1 DNA internalization-like competence protein ComEC/Rec2 [Paenibacillus dendritiformis C454]CAH8769649.1 ComEC/Rec2 family competence protein [Paenibacillus dendritiformis]